jgi:MGT family glycosyltransferase
MAEVAHQTVVFFPEGAHGPTNNCIGIGNVLKERGFRVVFVIEESFAGVLASRGFEERLMRLQPPSDQPEDPGQFWADFIRETAPHFRKNTYDQIETLITPIRQALLDGAKYVEPRLREIFNELQPDVIVEDNVITFPAVMTAGCPWVRIISCNPLEYPDPDLPPALSGLPTNDRSDWERWTAHHWELNEPIWTDFNAFVQENGCPSLPEREFIHESAHLNMYVYPAEADYERSRPLPRTFHRLESSARQTDPPWDLPAQLHGTGKLLYVSLGSLGSAEPELMNRLVQLLGQTDYRVIMSLGPQAGQIDLPDNIYGEEFLPQVSVLPHVDAVITHSGNNTVTECFHFGKPMLNFSLFWDQHDNAQRVDETGFGIRLQPYEFSDGEFYDALEDLSCNRERIERVAPIAQRLQESPGIERAAALIDQLAQTGEPVLRG